MTGAAAEIAVSGIWLDAMSAADWAAGLQLLDARENARWRRLKDGPAARQFLAGRGLLKRMLARRTGADAAAFSIGVAKGGRPFIERPAAFRKLSFSISHTTELAACAIYSDGAVGIDVERPRARLDVLGVARRFNPVEIARLQACPQAERPELFLKIWTLKEAFIKARGLGLAMALDGFWFDWMEAGIAPRGAAEGWHFAQCRLGAEHCLAVAVEDARLNAIVLRWQEETALV